MRTKLLIFLLFTSLNKSFALEASLISDKDLSETNIQQVFYEDGIVYIDGFNGPCLVNIYSIIGNKVFSVEILNLNSLKSIPVDLKAGNMFIIQIHSGSLVKTFKIIA